MISCCFTGHRPKGLVYGYNEEHPACKMIKYRLRQLIAGIIRKKSVTHFLSGLAECVDTWVAEIVLEIKAEHPNITLEAAIPCENQTASWNVKSKERWDRIMTMCDKVTVLQKSYTSDCMMRRNKYMVDSSDYVIAVWNGNPSGTANTIRYAVSMNKPVYYVDLRDFKMKALL